MGKVFYVWCSSYGVWWRIKGGGNDVKVFGLKIRMKVLVVVVGVRLKGDLWLLFHMMDYGEIMCLWCIFFYVKEGV